MSKIFRPQKRLKPPTPKAHHGQWDSLYQKRIKVLRNFVIFLDGVTF